MTPRKEHAAANNKRGWNFGRRPLGLWENKIEHPTVWLTHLSREFDEAHRPTLRSGGSARFCLTDSLHPDVPENQGPREPAENPPSALRNLQQRSVDIRTSSREYPDICPDEGVKCAEREDLSSLTVMCGLIG